MISHPKLEERQGFGCEFAMFYSACNRFARDLISHPSSNWYLLSEVVYHFFLDEKVTKKSSQLRTFVCFSCVLELRFANFPFFLKHRRLNHSGKKGSSHRIDRSQALGVPDARTKCQNKKTFLPFLSILLTYQ
jgi:hypothetical protein